MTSEVKKQSMDINKAIRNSARDRYWRFETIVHLGCLALAEALPPHFEDAVRDELPDIAQALGASEKKAFEMDADDLPELIRRKGAYGFLVQVAIPRRTYSDDSETFTSSWSCYAMDWLYGDDLESLLPKIETLVDKIASQDRERSRHEAAPVAAGQLEQGA